MQSLHCIIQYIIQSLSCLFMHHLSFATHQAQLPCDCEGEVFEERSTKQLLFSLAFFRPSWTLCYHAVHTKVCQLHFRQSSNSSIYKLVGCILCNISYPPSVTLSSHTECSFDISSRNWINIWNQNRSTHTLSNYTDFTWIIPSVQWVICMGL